TVIEQTASVAALPCETLAFVEQRLGCGRIAPSQLPSRRDLKARGIAAHYCSHPGDRPALDAMARALLVWSAFPDNTYADSGARFAEHFAQLQPLLEATWKSTVMSLPRGRPILVTSDHGYAFMGAGLTFTRHRDDVRALSTYFGGERYARISERG